ncbi:hypothetical protein [Streptomyces sp. NBC_00996]|uniref:hypothetical protein n=1 Tax=Streptomyces sp. NBC_00996 TaxID=2903710 RepID=UPI00386A2F24|nr:hypothetical protein OG390_48395 [Streptomyces sp. NBC_00996]
MIFDNLDLPTPGVVRDPRCPRGPPTTATTASGTCSSHLFVAHDLTRDRLFGHVKTRKKRTQFLDLYRYLGSVYPPDVRIAIVCDIYSPHLSTSVDRRVGDWAAATT